MFYKQNFISVLWSLLIFHLPRCILLDSTFLSLLFNALILSLVCNTCIPFSFRKYFRKTKALITLAIGHWIILSAPSGSISTQWSKIQNIVYEHPEDYAQWEMDIQFMLDWSWSSLNIIWLCLQFSVCFGTKNWILFGF